MRRPGRAHDGERDPLTARSTTAAREDGGSAARVPPLVAGVLALQRSAGNRATCEALRAATPALAVARMKRTRPAPTVPKAPRRSVRQRTQSYAVDRERFWAGPTFGAANTFSGGVSVTADLGPAAGHALNYGSKPGAAECGAVNSLRRRNFKRTSWIKGHLLNDNLGGKGISANLTAMTHTANMAYKNTFETPVKNAITVCYSHGQQQDPNWYGVRVTAQVVGQRWPYGITREVRAVAHHVDTQCDYIAKSKFLGGVQVVAQPAWAPALPGPLSTLCYQ